ncbi:MAG: CinA family nicotinamide mononucleotide deamidase-related protein [Acidimicrobiales bacterium]
MTSFTCEVVAVGTELLLGQIVDTNSSWIGEQLALAGIDSHFQTKVGDNHARIKAALDQALARSDAVIVCGGLGPTQDDITRNAIAEVMGVELVVHDQLVARIEAIFEGRQMPLNNLRQAEVPVGAEPLDVMPGTAPGLRAPVGNKVIYAVPGVPWEMKQMVQGAVLPDLLERAGVTAIIRSRTLRTWGESEGGVAERLAPEIERLDRDGGCTLAFLASGIEGLKLRITAKADTGAEVDALLVAEADRLRQILGTELIFSDDDESMEAVVLDLCRGRGLTLGVAESLTGGLISSRLTAVPGASDVFRGSIVCYASDVKFGVLGVREGPVISEQAVTEMAVGARRVLGVDVSVAVTGVAGPEPAEGHGVGRVWMATSVAGEVEAFTVKWPFGRDRIRSFTTLTVLNALRLRLLTYSKG